MISYTTTDRVFQLGDTRSAAKVETGLMDQIVVAVSRRLDKWLGQTFAFQHYDNAMIRAQITEDGILQVWIPSPTVSNVTSLSYRSGNSKTWSNVSGLPDNLNLVSSKSGSLVQALQGGGWRRDGTPIYVQVSYDGGWATIDDVPEDFEYATRRACWMEYKKRETTDQGKTAIPALGMIVTPSAWPVDLRSVFMPYSNPIQ